MDQDANQELGQSTENTQTQETSHEETGEQSQDSQDLVDLSKYSRVKLGDREMTRDELERGVMFQSDYTKKTQEIAQERRYVDNLQSDLGRVREHPALAAEFKRIYPQKFHQFLDYVVPRTNGQPQKTHQDNTQLKDPRVDEVLSKMQNWEQERHTERVSQASSEIDSYMTKFKSKYPYAAPSSREFPQGDESLVLAKLSRAIEDGEKIDQSKWEKIFKEAQSHYEYVYQEIQKQRIKEQKAAHVRGKDIAAGGGVPGGAPNQPRTIKDATKFALQDLAQNK